MGSEETETNADPAPEQGESEAGTERKPLHPKRFLYAALSLAPAFLLMSSDARFAFSVPLVALSCLFGAFFLLDGLGAFEPAGSASEAPVSLRGLGPSVIEFQLDPERASGWRMVIVQQGPGGGRSASSLKRGAVAALPERAPSLPADEVSPTPGGLPLPSAEVTGPVVPPEPERAASWGEVAEAMRVGNRSAAESGLQRLSRSSTALPSRERISAASQGWNGSSRGMPLALLSTVQTFWIRCRASG